MMTMDVKHAHVLTPLQTLSQPQVNLCEFGMKMENRSKQLRSTRCLCLQSVPDYYQFIKGVQYMILGKGS